MNRKSIAQEYMVLSVDENGCLAAMRQEEGKAGLVTAAFMDLLLAEVITIRNKKIIVDRPLPSELSHIQPLYEYLKEKSPTTGKLMSDYSFYGKGKLNNLREKVGGSLLKCNVVSEEKGGMFGPKILYVPESDYKSQLIGEIKAEATKGAITSHDIALLHVLDETKNLNRYFSNTEIDELKNLLQNQAVHTQLPVMLGRIRYVASGTMILLLAAILIGWLL